MANPFESDPELLALIGGPAPASPLAPLCAMMGVPVAFYWMTAVAGAASVLFPRLHTGYATEADRRGERARRHRDGFAFDHQVAFAKDLVSYCLPDDDGEEASS